MWTVQVARYWGVETIECADRAAAKRLARKIVKEEGRAATAVFSH